MALFEYAKNGNMSIGESVYYLTNLKYARKWEWFLTIWRWFEWSCHWWWWFDGGDNDGCDLDDDNSNDDDDNNNDDDDNTNDYDDNTNDHDDDITNDNMMIMI